MINPIANKFFTRLYSKLTGIKYNISYSQSGEDIIINFWKGAKRINGFTYFDIGANHPIIMNNTYKFYELGYRGICLEPDPFLCGQLGKKRKGDKIINCGVCAGDSSEAVLYIFEDKVLNTFSKEEAVNLVKNHGAKVENEISVPLININTLFEQNFTRETPTFLSMDIEGLDFEILTALDFNKYRPSIICLETVDYTDDASSPKRPNIMELMRNKGYSIFADTYLNTIFIDSETHIPSK